VSFVVYASRPYLVSSISPHYILPFPDALWIFSRRPLSAPSRDVDYEYTQLVIVAPLDPDPFAVVDLHTSEYRDNFDGASLLMARYTHIPHAFLGS
jgi:hypothetical protein